MEDSLITILRNKKTNQEMFRKTADKIANILAVDAMQFVKENNVKVKTPFEITDGKKKNQNVVLVPILRSGLAFLDIFKQYFDEAKVGFVGLKRDEKTAFAKKYYENLPKIGKSDLVIVLDPMIATGGSAVSALKILKNKGIKEKNILFVSLIAAPEGLEKIKKTFTDINIIAGVIDKGLNKRKFIVPGIGDFGDRYFGTE